MKMNRICRTALMCTVIFVLTGILVSEARSECAPDTCRDSSSGNAIGFHGVVRCNGVAVGAGIPVCFIDQATGNWSETCYTDSNGRYYLYPKNQGTPDCPNAPSGNYSAAANQCPTAQPCYSVVEKVTLSSSSLVNKNFTLDCSSSGGSCP